MKKKQKQDMKYELLEDHKVRLSDKTLEKGVYTKEQLEEAHKHDSLDFCIKYTKLGSKLKEFVEKQVKINKNKK